MKKQVLFFALCLLGFGASAQSWVSQATGFPNVSTGVFNVSAVDQNVVWISSYDGSGGAANYRDFSRTTDGGNTWIPGVVSAPAGHGWSMIFGLNADTAWAVLYNATVGTGGGIWKTTDGGGTWIQQGVGTIFNASSFPNVVHFWNATDGFAMGDPNPSEFEIYTTTDGGTTWVPVPGANIPAPLAGEYGIVDHYSVVGDTIWFDTNKGRVYKSVDKGMTWTVASTGIIVPANGAMDIEFWNGNEGIARLYNNTTGVNTFLKKTIDGGTTWSNFTITGNFFGSDMKYVPGTVSRIVSTGAAPGFVGSSYSDNGGITWIDIETSAQRTALGVVDTMTMWAGGFTTSPASDGIFKYFVIPTITCTDPSVSAGVSSVSDTLICPNETLTATSTGVVSPTVGTYAGIGWIITTADVTGTIDPLNEPSLMAYTTFAFPAPSTHVVNLLNDGTFIGSQIPYGVYYWTPVVFGNATAVVTPPVFLGDLALDNTCTMSGDSKYTNFAGPGNPLCGVGINEVKANVLAVYSSFVNSATLDLLINASIPGKAVVKIFDVTGRMVYAGEFSVNKGSNHELINVSNLGSGTYLIMAETGYAKATNKLVKLD